MTPGAARTERPPARPRAGAAPVVRILGIDPGFRQTGYGVIDIAGNHAVHVTHGHVAVQGEALAERLGRIFHEIAGVIREFRPAEAAVEKIFMYRNADSALKLGQARGAAVTACAELRLPVFEYTANQVKQAAVGKGHAQKTQVQYMVKVLLCLAEPPQEDAADALAVALCHGHSRRPLAPVQPQTLARRP